jgi:hypothetical protein
VGGEFSRGEVLLIFNAEDAEEEGGGKETEVRSEE